MRPQALSITFTLVFFFFFYKGKQVLRLRISWEKEKAGLLEGRHQSELTGWPAAAPRAHKWELEKETVQEEQSHKQRKITT